MKSKRVWAVALLAAKKTRFVALAAVGALALITAPTSLGSEPDRDDTTAGPNVVPAGIGCPFAVRREPHNNMATTTTFSDGRVQTIARAEVTLTNLANGNSILWITASKNTRTPGMDGGDDSVEVSGTFTMVVRPGEPSPLGGTGPALLGVTGHVHQTVDPDTGRRTSSSLDGQAVDLCAGLAAA